MNIYSATVLGLDGVSGCILMMHVTPFDNIGTTTYNNEAYKPEIKPLESKSIGNTV